MRFRFRIHKCRVKGFINIIGLIIASIGFGIFLVILLPAYPILVALILIAVGIGALLLC